jgi:hypothetical protein
MAGKSQSSEIYRATPIGIALTRSLNAMIMSKQITSDAAIKIMVRPRKVTFFIAFIFCDVVLSHLLNIGTLRLVDGNVGLIRDTTDSARFLAYMTDYSNEDCWSKLMN